MDYYGNNDWRDYHLAHYGRKGMRKGKHLPGITWWKELMPGQQLQNQANMYGQMGNAAGNRMVQQFTNKQNVQRTAEASGSVNGHDYMRMERANAQTNRAMAEKERAEEAQQRHEHMQKQKKKRTEKSVKKALSNLGIRAKKTYNTKITGKTYLERSRDAGNKAQVRRDMGNHKQARAYENQREKNLKAYDRSLAGRVNNAADSGKEAFKRIFGR